METVGIFRIFFGFAVLATLVAASRNDTTNSTDMTFPIAQIIKSCILESGMSASFDILVDVTADPKKSQFYVGIEQKASFIGRFVSGRLVNADPFLLYEHVAMFIADIERQMDQEKLFVGIVERGKIYYMNVSSTGIIERPTTTTTRAPPRPTLIDAFFHFGNEIAGILLDASGISQPTAVDDGPNFNDSVHMARMTRKVLDGREHHLAIHLPTSKDKIANFTIVITDGYQRTPPSFYPPPQSSVILDIGGVWSATTYNYRHHNVLLLQNPQDLGHFVQICRFMMCQSLGGNTGNPPIF